MHNIWPRNIGKFCEVVGVFAQDSFCPYRGWHVSINIIRVRSVMVMSRITIDIVCNNTTLYQ